MNKLNLLVGKSASGKTTIANILEAEYGHKQVNSYTTRAPRYDNESGHIFISEDEFDKLGELAAFTNYNGKRYGVTYDQLEQCDIYVIDIPGVETLLKNFNGIRSIRILYLDAAVSTRIDRFVDRHSSDMEIVSRLRHDDTAMDWYHELDKLVWHYKYIEQHDVELHRVDANKNIEDVLKQVLCYMNENNELE